MNYMFVLHINFLVFGFFKDLFTGLEKEQSHVVQAGWQKGAAQAGVNIILNVISTEITASELIDYQSCQPRCPKCLGKLRQNVKNAWKRHVLRGGVHAARLVIMYVVVKVKG